MIARILQKDAGHQGTEIRRHDHILAAMIGETGAQVVTTDDLRLDDTTAPATR